MRLHCLKTPRSIHTFPSQGLIPSPRTSFPVPVPEPHFQFQDLIPIPRASFFKSQASGNEAYLFCCSHIAVYSSYTLVCVGVGVMCMQACMQWVCVVVTVVSWLSYHVIFLQDLITDNSHPKYVYRVYCGHLYHQDCLNTYMKTPPFTGGCD